MRPAVDPAAVWIGLSVGILADRWAWAERPAWAITVMAVAAFAYGAWRVLRRA